MNFPPNQDELDFLWTHGFDWFGLTSTHHGITSDWLFRYKGKVYNLELAENVRDLDAIVDNKSLIVKK